MATLELTDDQLFTLNTIMNVSPAITINDQEGNPVPDAQERFDTTVPTLKWAVIHAAQKRQEEIMAAQENGVEQKAEKTPERRRRGRRR